MNSMMDLFIPAASQFETETYSGFIWNTKHHMLENHKMMPLEDHLEIPNLVKNIRVFFKLFSLLIFTTL